MLIAMIIAALSVTDAITALMMRYAPIVMCVMTVAEANIVIPADTVATVL